MIILFKGCDLLRKTNCFAAIGYHTVIPYSQTYRKKKFRYKKFFWKE